MPIRKLIQHIHTKTYWLIICDVQAIGDANKTNKQTKQMAKKKSCAIAPVHDADMAWYCLSRV